MSKKAIDRDDHSKVAEVQISDKHAKEGVKDEYDARVEMLKPKMHDISGLTFITRDEWQKQSIMPTIEEYILA